MKSIHAHVYKMALTPIIYCRNLQLTLFIVNKYNSVQFQFQEKYFNDFITSLKVFSQVRASLIKGKD